MPRRKPSAFYNIMIDAEFPNRFVQEVFEGALRAALNALAMFYGTKGATVQIVGLPEELTVNKE